ncbi:MAG: glucosaminidase domain-containing protein [Puniceicoccaceae bacterium]
MAGLSGQQARRLVLPAAALAGIILILVLAAMRPGPLFHRSLPDFSKVPAGEERKAAFFDFLHPYVEESNANVLALRRQLLAIERQARLGSLNRRHLYWLQVNGRAAGLEFARYEQPAPEQLEELERRLDIIPASLALAQAALESGWGTSRFAQQGNNLFGMWCYEPGCGIVPRKRPAGATYEVASYYSPRESFLAYINNLNSNSAYASLRFRREQSRLEGRSPTGLELADGLYRYSQEQWLYVEKVKGVIRNNNLTIYDQ